MKEKQELSHRMLNNFWQKIQGILIKGFFFLLEQMNRLWYNEKNKGKKSYNLS